MHESSLYTSKPFHGSFLPPAGLQTNLQPQQLDRELHGGCQVNGPKVSDAGNESYGQATSH